MMNATRKTCLALTFGSLTKVLSRHELFDTEFLLRGSPWHLTTFGTEAVRKKWVDGKSLKMKPVDDCASLGLILTWIGFSHHWAFWCCHKNLSSTLVGPKLDSHSTRSKNRRSLMEPSKNAITGKRHSNAKKQWTALKPWQTTFIALAAFAAFAEASDRLCLKNHIKNLLPAGQKMLSMQKWNSFQILRLSKTGSKEKLSLMPKQHQKTEQKFTEKASQKCMKSHWEVKATIKCWKVANFSIFSGFNSVTNNESDSAWNNAQMHFNCLPEEFHNASSNDEWRRWDCAHNSNAGLVETVCQFVFFCCQQSMSTMQFFLLCRQLWWSPQCRTFFSLAKFLFQFKMVKMKQFFMWSNVIVLWASCCISCTKSFLIVVAAQAIWILVQALVNDIVTMTSMFNFFWKVGGFFNDNNVVVVSASVNENVVATLHTVDDLNVDIVVALKWVVGCAFAWVACKQIACTGKMHGNAVVDHFGQLKK